MATTNHLRWMDSDMHLSEPVDFWEHYMDPAYKDYMPRWTGDRTKNIPLRDLTYFTIGEKALKTTEADPNNPDQLIRARRFHFFEPYLAPDGLHVDAPGQLRAMDHEGIDIAILFPTWAGRGWQDEGVDPGVALALSKAYNSWLHDFCQTDPSRLKMNALIPLGDVQGAIDEMHRAVDKLGAVSISPGSSRRDIRLDDAVFEPLWAEAEKMGVAVCFHGDRQVHLKDRYRNSTLLSHICGRGVEHPVAFMELLVSGVLERHPSMRCSFLEAGASWVPYWIFRLEEEWERFRDVDPVLARNMTMRPIDYWKRQCWSAVEVDEWTLAGVIQTIGDDNLVISSDFPHFDSPFPDARERFTKIPDVSIESKRKILWDNCARLYNLN